MRTHDFKRDNDEDTRDGQRRVHYAVNRREGTCLDCDATLAPGKGRIWSRGHKRPWGIACLDKGACLARQVAAAQETTCDVCGGPAAGAVTCTACVEAMSAAIPITVVEDPWAVILGGAA